MCPLTLLFKVRLLLEKFTAYIYNTVTSVTYRLVHKEVAIMGLFGFMLWNIVFFLFYALRLLQGTPFKINEKFTFKHHYLPTLANDYDSLGQNVIFSPPSTHYLFNWENRF